MTISRDLFLAILAMDSYNRGYGAGIAELSDADGSSIGAATISDREGGATAQAFDFYGIAYTVGAGVDGIAAGTKVIAYRGTDSNSINPLGPAGFLLQGRIQCRMRAHSRSERRDR